MGNRAWEALLVQVQANRSQAETNLLQSRANEATSRGLQCLIGHWVDKQCSTEVEPDTLAMWYALNDDATDGNTIAGHVELQAKAVWMRGEAANNECQGHKGNGGEPSPAEAARRQEQSLKAKVQNRKAKAKSNSPAASGVIREAEVVLTRPPAMPPPQPP